MGASFVIPLPQILVLDTGPLWELILCASVRKLRFEGLNSRLKFLREDSSYGRFTEFISGFSRKMTTPHVVSEIGSKILKTEPQTGRPYIWRVVHDEFKS